MSNGQWHSDMGEGERDAAVAKATTYERDWYDAKSEFGTATAKLRERVRVVERERDEARAQVERLRALLYGFTG